MKSPVDSHYNLFIDGEWVKAASGKTTVTKNPSNGEDLAVCEDAGPEDVDKAVKAAPPPCAGELMITKDTLVEEVLDMPGAISYCIKKGVSPFTCSGDYPRSIGFLLEARKVEDPDGFIAGLNELARRRQSF